MIAGCDRNKRKTILASCIKEVGVLSETTTLAALNGLPVTV